MIHRSGKFFLTLLIFFVFTSTSFSQFTDNKPVPNQIKNGGVGLKVGVINTGKLTVAQRELDPQASISFGVFFEFKLASRVVISPAFDLYNIHIYSLNNYMADLNILLKPILYSHHSSFAVKPSVGVGIGRLASWEIAEMTSATTYLSAKANIELAFFSMKKHAWLLEVGYSAYPSGGNSKVDASINPSLTVRVGVMY
jgi:hypothetical protein